MIYLDNAATSFPKPEKTVRAMAEALVRCGANPGRAGHRLALEAGRIVEGCRETAAQMLGEQNPSRVVFCQNATDALNMAIHGTVRTGDHVVSTLLEHNSVLRPLTELARGGVITLTLVPPDESGMIRAEDIGRAMTRRTRLVVMTHMSNVLGKVQNVAAVGRVCAGHGARLLVDCAQTAGHLPLHPMEWGCHMLAMPGHKGLLGPHGTGLLWVKSGVKVMPSRQGGTGSASESMAQPAMMPDSLESGTLNLPGIAGLRAGMDIAFAGMQSAHAHIVSLCDFLRGALGEIPGVRVYTQPGASIVSFNVAGVGSQMAASLLDQAGIAVRGGLHCAPGVHRFLGTLEGGCVRVSPGRQNTREECVLLLRSVAEMAK